jgi:hypothetical protein
MFLQLGDSFWENLENSKNSRKNEKQFQKFEIINLKEKKAIDNE